MNQTYKIKNTISPIFDYLHFFGKSAQNILSLCYNCNMYQVTTNV